MNSPTHQTNAPDKPYLIMAPLKGFTDHVFRNLYADHFNGFDISISPFVASKRDRKIKWKYVKDLWPERNEKLPVIPQILGKSPEDFTVLADYLFDMGYDTVNWNLGCPFPTVAGKKRGSGMLPHTRMIHDFLDHVMTVAKPKVSIKIRLGWETPDDIFRLIPILNTYPLDEIIIHPRTGIQRYGGSVDHDSFAYCLDHLSARVVYNGDIRCANDFFEIKAKYPGVTKWMIGRGCLFNPFLPEEIKHMTANKGARLRRDNLLSQKAFHEDLFKAYQALLDGPSHLLNKMKGFWNYTSLPFTGPEKRLKKVKKAKTPDIYLNMVNSVFGAALDDPDLYNPEFFNSGKQLPADAPYEGPNRFLPLS